ncbi:MAG: DNA-protecting protein DprA [Acidimicrobiia bacterium]|nr:DNA-protecting protein DprA [Acidimicrobiia bacterium]
MGARQAFAAATRRDGAGAPPARLGPAANLCAAAALVERRGTRAWISGDDDYPIHDEVPLRPPVLLGEGDVPGVLDAPRVAIVGTRAATPHGLADARDLGSALTDAGVTVVSGLAIGIDAAAHEGALDSLTESDDAEAGPVGVVATGLDVVYPRRHRALFDRVRRRGLIVGEVGYGAGPIAWRFPVRNRIIAALADVVVVVEATASGGARITAEYAAQYGRPVLAVPGSRRNPAAAGCNALLADGAHPLLEPSDVLLALGLAAGGRPGWIGPPGAALSADARAVRHAFGGEPATADQLAGRSGLPPERVSGALRELERAGRAERSRGLLWPR